MRIHFQEELLKNLQIRVGLLRVPPRMPRQVIDRASLSGRRRPIRSSPRKSQTYLSVFLASSVRRVLRKEVDPERDEDLSGRAILPQ